MKIAQISATQILSPQQVEKDLRLLIFSIKGTLSGENSRLIDGDPVGKSSILLAEINPFKYFGL